MKVYRREKSKYIIWVASVRRLFADSADQVENNKKESDCKTPEFVGTMMFWGNRWVRQFFVLFFFCSKLRKVDGFRKKMHILTIKYSRNVNV